MIMETRSPLKRAFDVSVTLSRMMMILLVLSAIVVEVVRMRNGAFAGWSPERANQVRDYVYGVTIVLPLCLGYLRKAVLKGSAVSGAAFVARRLTTATALTLLVAGMPALLGLGLFLLGGFRTEFYVALGYSLMVLLIYFPRVGSWERWLGESGA